MAFYLNRFSGVERKTYEVEIVTPMFLGGADPEKAELRVPPIKGMLRFWWRATCGIDKLGDMKNKEDDIFGSTTKKSSFSISLKMKDDLEIKPKLEFNEYKKLSKTFVVSHNNKPINNNIIDYLSYGTYEYNKLQHGNDKNVYKKEHIPPKTKFDIIFSFYNDKYKADIIKSFQFLLSFSGIGAKNRNGFGSIYSDEIINIEDKDIVELKKDKLKDFLAFSKKVELFDNFSERDTWEESISDIGLKYREARLSIETTHSYIKRKLISAPLQVDKINKAEEERHSKPYFLKVRKLKNGKFKGIILYMPYNYHFKGKLHDYLNTCDLLNKELKKPPSKLKE